MKLQWVNAVISVFGFWVNLVKSLGESGGNEPYWYGLPLIQP